jgi:hypothetical protein
LLGYFRINDPYRLVIIFFLVMLLRLPYLISSEWLSIPELRWLLVGETLNEGDLLYVDILDDIGPLSAYVYSVLNFLFGRSQLAIQIFGLILFCFQVFYINHLALKHKMYNENNYLPALFYGILGLSSFNLITLSPIMMGLTFILFSLNGLLTQIESRNKTDANLINIGIFTGLALLFYIPFFLDASGTYDYPVIFYEYFRQEIFAHDIRCACSGINYLVNIYLARGDKSILCQLFFFNFCRKCRKFIGQKYPFDSFWIYNIVVPDFIY